MTPRSRLLAPLCASACLAIAILATPAFAATPAWQPIAVSGPTNLPPLQSETQRLGVDAEGGTFELTARHTAARGTGRLLAGFSRICISSISSGSFSVGQGVVGIEIPPGATITAVNSGGILCGAATEVLLSSAPFDENSEVEVFGIDASATTAPLHFDAPATESEEEAGGPESVEKALNTALATVDGAGASASVAGGPGGPDAEHPYLVTFGGSLADMRVAPLGTDASSLTGSGSSASVLTIVPGGAGTGTIAIYAQNVGGESSSGPIHVEVKLPEGVNTAATPLGGAWSCSPTGAGQQSFTCAGNAPVQPGGVAEPVKAPVVTGATASGTRPVEVRIEGGGGKPVSYSMPLTVSSTPAEPGIQAFTAGAHDADGVLDTRAGGHPYSASTAIFANTHRTPFGRIVPVGEFKDIDVDLPPGFLGNPIATQQCPESELAGSSTEESCPPETIVGRAAPVLDSFGNGGVDRAVYNVEAPFGYPGKFYFNVLEVPIHAVGSLRSDGDYGLTVSSLNTAQIATVFGSFFTFWGSPADPAHDSQRCLGIVIPCNPPVESTAPKTAFLTNPVDCAREALEPPITRLRVTLWQSPLVTHESSVPIEPVTGCDKLHFEAGFAFEPSATNADSPASFRTSLTVPSAGLTTPNCTEKEIEEGIETGCRTTPEIKDAVVQLPKGVVLNASGADGLQACSLDQIGFKGSGFGAPNPMRFDKDPNTCPEASKIGSGELKTALLSEPLHGSLYLAAQGDGNPFGSLFAIYLVIEDPRHGVFIKLPGRVDPDPQDGQMTVTFENLPQLPFTRLDLNLKGGSRSALASPMTCGNFVATVTNMPWSAPESGPPFESAGGFEIDQGANGRPCASSESQLPLDLGLHAGTTKALAGAHSPFTMRLTRPDGAQTLEGFELTTPEGFSATLRGIPYCSDAQLAHAAASDGTAEQVNPSCPAASQIGTTKVGAGAGPTPYYVDGKVYLTGPYKGSKLSLAAIVPAVAGPFDLGVQVVRAPLRVNPRTAQLTAVTDPLPQILDGVVLRIRDIRVDIDRPGFALNPTDCSVQAVSARVTGTAGAVANLASRFQVGGCEHLGFKPKLKLKLKGGTRRGAHPALRAVLLPRPGDANFARAAVTLPHSAFLDQAHIRTICTRVQFAAEDCPKAAIYGHARAFTPLLDDPLEGPVYLRSSDNKLPDLVADLEGQVDVELVGRIDSIHGGIRNTFDVIPDAPVSKFVLTLQGGRKGLVVNSTDLCAKAHRATVKLKAQNNRHRAFRPKVVATKCKKTKHRRR